MLKKYSTTKSLKKWVRNLIKIIILFFLLFGVYLMINSLNFTAPVRNLFLSYDVEQNIKYDVEISENDYIDEDSLNSNASYVTNLVQNIKIDFNYVLDSTKAGDFEYEYDIIGIIYGEYQGSSTTGNSGLWTKKYNLLNKVKENALNTNSININETIDLDFQKYDNEVSRFKQDLSVPINAYLEIVLNIKVNGLCNENKVVDNKVQKITIPLNQIAFSINKDYKANDHKEIVHTDDNRQFNMMKFNAGILLIVYSFTMLGLTYKMIFTVKTKTKFETEIERILKSYGDIIIELATPIDVSDKQIALVKSFNEMLDLEEELRVPINYIEIAKNKGEFFIINGEICYKYYLTDKF